MTAAFVLILSIILRFVAAFMAFRLIPLTGRQMAWSLISISMLFMGLRQCFPLFHLLSGNISMQPDLYAELVGLIISIAMVAGISGIAPIFIDRKRIENALRESEERSRAIFESASDGILIANPKDKRFIQANTAICSMLGYTKEEIDQLTIRDIHPPEAISRVFEEFKKQAKMETIVAESLPVLRKDGSIFYADISSTPIVIGGTHYIVGIFRDITERKKAEKALLFEKQRLMMITDHTPYGLAFIGADGTFEYINPSFTEMFGYDLNDVPNGKAWFENAYPDPQHRKEIISTWLDDLERTRPGEKRPRVFTITCKDGSKKAVNLISVLLETGQNIMVCQDITQLKESEEKLVMAASQWRATFDSIADPVMILDKDFLIVRANRAVASLAKLPVDKVPGNRCYELLHHSKNPLEACPLAKMRQTKKRTEIETYIDDMGKWFAVTVDPMLDDDGNLTGAVHAMRDITAHKHAEEALRESMDRLKGAMQGIVDTISAAVEARDPYTSGHQRRVSDIAAAIAAQMGLSESRIEGIRTAGVIHDLGKISIPSEILSKPRKLSDIEFELMKTHPQIGYDILKDIKFPWPIAQIILQHHEKLDGSGYPQGLRGSEILLEARILAVADVVEAIASHRPYRASLGIGVALEEIEKNKGTLYDTDAVRECLKLFREKGYKIS